MTAPGVFDDAPLDAALFSVLGEEQVPLPPRRTLLRSLLTSRRASATLGLAVTGVAVAAAILTLAPYGADEARTRAEVAVPARAANDRVAMAPVAAPTPSAPAPIAAPSRELASQSARDRPDDGGSRARAVTRPPALRTALATVRTPARRASSPAFAPAEPAAAIDLADAPVTSPATAPLLVPVRAFVDPAVTDEPARAIVAEQPARPARARRDSVVAIRSFRRQW